MIRRGGHIELMNFYPPSEQSLVDSENGLRDVYVCVGM